VASTATNYSSLININFPPEGQALTGVTDFIKNFKNIKSSFDTIIDEVDRLDQNLVKLKDSNNFGGQIIQNAIFTNTSYTVYDIGLVSSGVVDIDYSLAHYQQLRVDSGYYLFNITNWPITNSKGWLRLEIKNNSTTLTTECKLYFSGNINYLYSSATLFSLPPDQPVFFDLWTYNNGDTVFVRPLGVSTGAISTGTVGIGGGAGSTGPLPFITRTNPQQAAASGGTIMSVVGGNFGASPRVFINGNQLATITSSSPTEIYFYSLAAMSGSYQTVFVRTDNGDSNLASYWIFEDATGE